jgi:molybdopterin synthase sulfur carrier subunit
VTLRTEASATALRVSLRFFAAARAAVGRDVLDVELPAGSTIADALAAVARQLGAPSSPVSGVAPADAARVDAVAHAEAVFRRCSFLVNGVAVTDQGRVLGVDVMPPFAGG